MENSNVSLESETDASATEIRTALNFIVGSIEYYYQRGIADEETLNALKEAFAEFHRLDAIIRQRGQPDELVEWEQLMAYAQEKEQIFREIEGSREDDV